MTGKLVFLTCLSLVARAVSIGQEAPQPPSAAKQFPNLKSMPDRSEALQSLIDGNGGSLILKKGVYRITKTLEIDLAKHGAVMVRARNGGVTFIMDGPGPAIRVTGSHQGTASPKSFQPETWNERMPIIESIEIVGNHPEADGIELIQTVEPIVTRVAVRWCRHGILLSTRNRNVTISDCHLYENGGVGLYLNDVNLHQINVSNSHISYNRGGGIVVRDGNVRNLQVTGCDIEGNMPGDPTPTKTANIWLDVSGSPGDKSKSIAEVAITGCTIQHSANYGADREKTVAEGGANIRLSGKDIYPVDSVAITGNVLSDTTTNIDIDRSMDVTISGNTFFAPKPANLAVSNSKRVVVTGNTFNPRQFKRPGTIRFANSQNCILSNSTLNEFQDENGAVQIENCEGMIISGLILSDCKRGIVLKDNSEMSVVNNIARGLPEGKKPVETIETEK